MEKIAFINLLKNFITPLFTGCEVDGEEESSSRDNEIALGQSGAMLVKYDKDDIYRTVLTRDLPFKNKDVLLVKSIFAELKVIDNYKILETGHIKNLQLYSLEKAICKTVCEYSSETLHGLINELNLWSTRTYEGNSTTFGFIVNDEDKETECDNSNLHYSKVLSRDFSAVICDGLYSCIELDSKGYVLNHISIPQLGFAETYSPYNYVNMAHQCYGNKIGLSLLPNGDMLVFQEQELVFAKRRGQWNCFSHEEVTAKLAVKSTEQNLEIRNSIYLTSIDTSFAKTGGCVVLLRKDSAEIALSHIDIFDIVSETYYNLKRKIEFEKIEFTTDPEEMEEFLETYKDNYEEFSKSPKAIKNTTLRTIINGRKFQDLNRILRQELVGVDGATIIDSEGNIIATGAIIQIQAGSTGGGRLAAAKTLSKYGVSVKISADGIIEGFTYDKTQDKAKTIFSTG